MRELGRVNFNTAMYGAREEGREEGQRKVALTMHSKGMSGEQIASILDLELAEVEQFLGTP